MAFIHEHPDYKDYISYHDYHYHDVPTSAWSEFESLIDMAGGPERESLSRVVQKLATKVGFGSVADGNPYQWIPDVVRKLRIKVQKGGRFDLFMDCLALLSDEGEIGLFEINSFLSENDFGYRVVSALSGIVWEKVEDDPILFIKPEAVVSNKSQEKSLLGENNMNKKDRPTIFITHSSKDREYVLAFSKLLRNLRVPNDSIICTSDPRHKIPNGESAFVWLREQFLKNNLHMVFILSKNYYDSSICLNEMGAAWLVAKKSDVLLLSGFSFADFKNEGGCLDSNIQAGSIDSEDAMLKAWLNNLRDDVISEFFLEKPNDLDWEDYRDDFIREMRSVYSEKVNKKNEEESQASLPVVGEDDVGTIPVDSAFLLVYAAEEDGHIFKSQTLGSPARVYIQGKQFMLNDSLRESARWVEALDRLIIWGWVKQSDHKGEIYELTGTGYMKADWLKDVMQIDTNNSPLDELKEFDV